VQYDFFYLCYQRSLGTHSVEQSDTRMCDNILSENVQVTAEGICVAHHLAPLCRFCDSDIPSARIVDLGLLTKYFNDTYGIIVQYFILF